MHVVQILTAQNMGLCQQIQVKNKNKQRSIDRISEYLRHFHWIGLNFKLHKLCLLYRDNEIFKLYALLSRCNLQIDIHYEIQQYVLHAEFGVPVEDSTQTQDRGKTEQILEHEWEEVLHENELLDTAKVQRMTDQIIYNIRSDVNH